jgi:hypothetical protein
MFYIHSILLTETHFNLQHEDEVVVAAALEVAEVAVQECLLVAVVDHIKLPKSLLRSSSIKKSKQRKKNTVRHYFFCKSVSITTSVSKPQGQPCTCAIINVLQNIFDFTIVIQV